MARADELRGFADEHLWYEIKSISDLTARLTRHAELFENGLSEGDGDLAGELLEPAGRKRRHRSRGDAHGERLQLPLRRTQAL